ncbi:polysaccharide deacetylase family protein [Fretibacter rubidus]|uniref:polysaccharide deacetylase family protein n=1 Tax=Fretibacter rubidus TaxID=570162 RepID=UPI00352ADF46
MHNAYAPSNRIMTKVMRRITPLRNRRDIRFTLDRPLVSFTYDDCPLSAVSHGLKPMEREGWRGTVYVASKLFGITNHHGLHMSADDAVAVARNGHEIGGHSFSHIDGNLTPIDEFMADVARNQNVLTDLGIANCSTFAYPFGEVTPALKTALSRQFIGLRGITPKAMTGRADLNQIASYPVFQGQDTTRAIAAIKASAERPAWITLFMHEVSHSPSKWGCTPPEMQAVIKAVKDVNARVLPVADAITFLKGGSDAQH